MPNREIRWMQRFSNYKKALARLTEAIQLNEERKLSDLEQQGLIQAFEFTFDMGWKTLQDYVTDRGYDGERGKPNLIISEASKFDLINESNWKLLTKARNQTSHTYDEEIADEVAKNIIEEYHGFFIQLETRLQLEKINQEKQG